MHTECLEFVNYLSVPGSKPHLRFPLQFGSAGDVNGDRYEDLVVHNQGGVYIYFNPLGALDFPFVRGDVNQDGAINIADAIAALDYLFAGRSSLPCFDAADVNDDEAVNIADPIFVLGWLFGGGPLPPPPNECGPDPTGNGLGCAESVCQ
jgi:hypothetical protein